MPEISVIIPTIKSLEAVKDLIDEINRSMFFPHEIIATCKELSAAQNRNYGLDLAKHRHIIMLDDDVTGFADQWDVFMIAPLAYSNVALVSARLMRPDGRPGIMVGDNYDMQETVIIVEKRRLPTACIAFENDGIRFDENFVGSGFEDDDFCKTLGIKYPNGRFIINNAVQVIHKNEMKNQGGRNWELNRRYFLQKWPDEENRWNIGSLE